MLPVVFLFDSILNSGLMVATNGYMLTIAPQQNRSMFIASITGLAGICGGLGAILGGAFLNATGDISAHFLGRDWCNYHLLFAVNIPIRLACIALVLRIQEPKSTAPETLLSRLGATWPMRFLLFPIGLYRNGKSKLT